MPMGAQGPPEWGSALLPLATVASVAVEMRQQQEAQPLRPRDPWEPTSCRGAHAPLYQAPHGPLCPAAG